MSNYSDYIWSVLYDYIGNEYGTAGLMGNLQAESGMIPYRLQGDFTTGYSTSINYTNNVDAGRITESEFVNDSKGYGLAQWTYYSRKQNLYNMYISGGYSSIGDVGLACAYLISELNSSYAGVLAVLRTATTVKQASDIVLHQFENPAEQGPDVGNYRESLGLAIYAEYTGGPYPPPVPPEPPTPTQPSIPYWLLFKLSENGKQKH